MDHWSRLTTRRRLVLLTLRVRASVTRSVTSTISATLLTAALLGAPGLRAASAAEPSRSKVEFGIAYGTEKRHWLQWAVKQFSESPEGQEIQVNLLPFGSMEGAHAIVAGDEKIHVWAPASSIYRDIFLRDWEAKHPGKAILKEEQLAFTPMVIVMWKSRYQAYMARCPEVSLRTFTFAMHAKTGWGRIADKPEWGCFKFGHTHPLQSNSGLMTLIVLAYEFHRKTAELAGSDIMSAAFLEHLERFQSGVTGLSNSTGNMMEEMLTKGPSSYDALMVYEAVAIDFFKKAEGRWKTCRSSIRSTTSGTTIPTTCSTCRGARRRKRRQRRRS